MLNWVNKSLEMTLQNATIPGQPQAATCLVNSVVDVDANPLDAPTHVLCGSSGAAQKLAPNVCI